MDYLIHLFSRLTIKYDCYKQSKHTQKNKHKERCPPVCMKKKDNVWKTEKAILEDCKNLSVFA